jgi:hypothetical protein
MKNYFENPSCCKVGQLPKQMEENIWWIKQTTSKRSKVVIFVNPEFF